MNWDLLRETEKPIFLYGMGDGADRILDHMESLGLRPTGVFASDEFVRGQNFRGFTVVNYDAAKAEYGDMIVLLAFGSNRPEVLERVAYIASEQELYAPDFPVAKDSALFTPDFFNSNREKLFWVYERLADEQSRHVFNSLISYKLTGSIASLRSCETLPEEAYETILRLKEQGETLVDLGAYRGDTIAEFIGYCPGYEAIYAMEPDAYTFRHLAKNTEGLRSCHILHAAAGEKPGTAFFVKKGGRGSSLGKTGIEIPVESTDSMLCGAGATFFNIDVEGNEQAAIAGSSDTIRKYRPKLLIAAYHRSEDLFAIPMQVLELRPDYKLYLRHFPQLPGWEYNYYFV